MPTTAMRAEQELPRLDPSDKARYVRDMFAGIAHRYDLLNDLMSFGRHHAWRKKAVKMANLKSGDRALDVCTGTGDFARDLHSVVGNSGLVAACDFCLPMLEAGMRKHPQHTPLPSTNHEPRTAPFFAVGDALNLPYRSGAFDCVTVGFGIRNVADVERAVREMARVAKQGGRVIILEFTQPRNPLLAPIIRFFEHKVLPTLGGLLSRKEAYTYLPKSIETFQTREQLAQTMRDAGLADVRVYDLNFGSVAIHIGVKQ